MQQISIKVMYYIIREIMYIANRKMIKSRSAIINKEKKPKWCHYVIKVGWSSHSNDFK